MDTSKITNVLIFKDGFYYLTIHPLGDWDNQCYQIVPDEWDIHNGFEFASDAYAYLAKLSDEKVEK